MVQERLSGPGPRARTPAARAACRGRAGSLRGPRPGSEVQKLGGAGRGSAASPPPPRAASRARPREPRKSGAGAGEAGSPDRRSARSGLSSVLPPSPEHRGRERACGRLPFRGPLGPACRSTCLPSALAPAGWHSSRRGRGGARSPRQRRAVDRECRAHSEPAELGFPQVERARSAFPALPAGPLPSLEPRQHGGC